MYKDMIDTIGYVAQADPELGAAMNRELGRQRQNIELIASENIVSPAVMAAMGSVLTNKSAEGYPGHRYYGGCQYVDEVEQLAIDRACKLFGAKYANVQPHSGAQANLAVYFALLNLGDTVMGMDLSQGGHLTHGSPVNMSGKNYNFVSYGVSTEDGRIDYAALAKQVAKVRPKLIVAGASAYPRAIDFEKLAEIAHGYGAMLMVDMAHIAGLVAGGQHQNPVPYADVVTTTTHKTLRGPRGGLILTNNEYLIKRINSAIFPGTQGGPLEHVIAAKAVCFGEALKPEFKEYARKIVENAKALEAELTVSFGGKVRQSVRVSVCDRIVRVPVEMIVRGALDPLELWAPGHPALYDLRVRLLRDGEAVDQVDTYFGMRKIERRGGLILTNNEYIIKRINSAIFPGTQGGPLEHVIAAKAVCFGEALKPEFKEYARKIVENAKALEAELTARGVKLVSGGTDNHLLLIDLTDEDCTGKELEHNLDEVHITANKNTVPGEKRSPFVTSGVRIGTPAVTTRGMGPDEMKVIADCIADCVFDFANKKDEVASKVEELTKKFPLYE